MAFEFRLPDIGEGIVEGEIVKWLVRPGDPVLEDQPMVEVMTDKATVVIPSPRAGRVLECRGNEGDIARVHEILVVIDDGAARAVPASASETTASSTRNGQSGPERSVATLSSTGAGKVLAAPATRRLARELGVDLAAVPGSGPGGRVTSADVQNARAPATDPHPAPFKTPPAPKAPSEALSERVEIRGVRRKIWENMARSKALAAHFTFVEECDATKLVELRRRMNDELGEGEGTLTFLPFVLKATLAALKHFPDLNGHLDEEGGAFIRRRDYHLGVAVSTERGLVVPVVRNADRLSLLALSAEIARLAERARAGRLSSEDLGGSTFTVTSLGKEGGIFATPIINHPEVGIMGVHRMQKRPVVTEDDQIAVRSMMNLSLSFDHRWIDGHVGAAFTYRVIRMLQNPNRLFLEMG